jgi:hypothetical protein
MREWEQLHPQLIVMDTLFWTQFNSEVTIKPVTKKYFSLYLYKLSVYAPAGRVIEKNWQNIDEALARRKEIADRNIHWGGSWFRAGSSTNGADPVFLSLLGRLRHETENVRFRIEEPYVSIYAQSEQELKDLVTNNFNSDQLKYIRDVFGPTSADAELALNSGAIIRKQESGYKYKVIIRDGKYSQEVKEALYNYLMNSGETSLSKGCQEQLIKSFSYIWNVFFYTNDPDIVHFINLIAPNSIANIHELIILADK